MIHFPVLRTNRFTVQIKELSFGDAADIAGILCGSYESESTIFLNKIIDSVSQGIADPLAWTVQERMLVIAHYISHVSDDGPNFLVSGVDGGGVFSDYVDVSNDYQHDSIEIGELLGDKWMIRPLTGRMAESIERIKGELKISQRLHWVVGSMAAQLYRLSDEIDNKIDKNLLETMQVLLAFPDSDLCLLMHEYYAANEQLQHLFNIDYTDDGIVALPKKGVDGNLPPARFPVHACISEISKAMARKPE
jgi:hypothetical protein